MGQYETTDAASRSRVASVFESLQIAPSILAADFAALGAQVEEVMAAGARLIHVDVMDGHFVPPITIGPLIVSAIADQVKNAGGAIDVHLMIEQPERQIAEFAKAGADAISLHIEATAHAHRALAQVRESGCLAGIVLNPSTTVELLSELKTAADFAVCMSVNPGWGGQPFIDGSVSKIARMREILPDAVRIEVDGGIDHLSVRPCSDAGASLLVAGSAIFGAPDPAAAFAELAAAAANPA